ncbi:hypothetical protein J7I98_16750 [Streptomyces sp. ISL-98]|uniref:hypothetical protein n=1 Tax=Streptomyces sp. ISL-98 TaxID=2819192 RepID=UPI001BE97790|nr:hypothetical protein [Streptomyces sp. ISL-98]MBT2507504.1 hypothetical protein [Streptomyces sp. ISL-98]
MSDFQVRPGKTYRIKNYHTGQYITPQQWEIGKRERAQAAMWSKSDNPRQAWHIFGLDANKKMIVNATGGEILSPYTRAVDHKVVGTPVWYYNATYMNQQSWFMRPVGDGCFHIANVLSGGLMAPDSYDPGNTEGNKGWAGLGQYFQAAPEDKLYWWYLEEAHDVPYVQPYRRDNDVLTPTPKMTSRNDPGDTKKELISRTLVPFLMIDEFHDGSRDYEQTAFYRRAGATPYYAIERFGYWKRFNYEAYDSPKQFEKNVDLKYGVVSENTKKVESTTGIEVKLDLGCAFKGVSASISTTLKYELHVSESSSTKTESSKTETTKVIYPAGKGFAGTTWVRADEYVLSRVEPSGQTAEITRWETVNKAIQAVSSWPPSKESAPPAPAGAKDRALGE